MFQGAKPRVAALILVVSGYIPVWTPSQAWAAPSPKCQELTGKLQDLRKAQHTIITSLAQNHDVFADQLSALSFELALYKKNVPQKALSAMDKSAEAYRARSLKAYQTAEKLDESTSDLIKKIQSCLK